MCILNVYYPRTKYDRKGNIWLSLFDCSPGRKGGVPQSDPFNPSLPYYPVPLHPLPARTRTGYSCIPPLTTYQDHDRNTTRLFSRSPPSTDTTGYGQDTPRAVRLLRSRRSYLIFSFSLFTSVGGGGYPSG